MAPKIGSSPARTVSHTRTHKAHRTHETQFLNGQSKPDVIRHTGPRTNQDVLDKAHAKMNQAVSVATSEYDNYVGKRNSTNTNWDWCGFFANHCYGDKPPLFGLKRVGRTQEIRKAAEEQGYFSKANTGYVPKVGDLALWTGKTNKQIGHIGIVTAVYEDGSYVVTEGNRADVKGHHNGIAQVTYNSQSHADADTKTKSFVGFVRMEDYLYDREAGSIRASLDIQDTPQDLYIRDDKPTMAFDA